MVKITLLQRLKISITYCIPALLACAILVYSYYSRLATVNSTIMPTCENNNIPLCVVNEVVNCVAPMNGETDPHTGQMTKEKDKKAFTVNQYICQLRKNFAQNRGFSPAETESTKAGATSQSDAETAALLASLAQARSDCPGGKAANCLLAEMTYKVETVVKSIFTFNAGILSALTLLVYILLGDLLARSRRIELSFQQRMESARANFWLKFFVALIIGEGTTYIFNPMGRAASAYNAFFISVGLENAHTLPIYISTEQIVPVLAGFLGWYLHLIGYTFTKLIHHDVISSRAYGLLFKKFIITYGIALVIPSTGLLSEGQSTSILMFLVGLFPLSAMSLLMDLLAKYTSSSEKPSGSLSELPGISRWQILRLEEEGIDSLAALANAQPKTIAQNLHVMDKLVFFWVDIAQLYIIIGQEAYLEIKSTCLTASEFIRKANDPLFIEKVNALETLNETGEIARLLQRTFSDKLVDQVAA